MQPLGKHLRIDSQSTRDISFLSLVWADPNQLRPFESMHQVLKRVEVVVSVEGHPFNPKNSCESFHHVGWCDLSEVSGFQGRSDAVSA